MLQKVLVANRGEIACRIIKTLKRLNITSVAVFSAVDSNALHVQMADEAYLLGGAKVQESYLDAKKIIAIAKQCNADAIHPGYGFLSENANFAEMCVAAGICFIGPSSEVIAAMGDKAAAKNLMQASKVPVIPGYQGEAQDVATITKVAADIGYPILLKASSGGGGKGMRIVTEPSKLEDAIASAKREAKASFGDDRLIVEKYLQHPRHIEVQVFGDNHGNAVYLFERDCSIQRRHQKIIEEAPALGIDDNLRQQLGETAVVAAKAIKYQGAGTIEFLLDKDKKFYFMEMNTRLQVEHPVTEMVTGVDLVEWQLLVAANNKLPLTQQQLKIHGHAIEARIYAENPQNDFLPAVGTIFNLVEPKDINHIRFDNGVKTGDEVSVYYDPMLAKVIAWGEQRQSAVRNLQCALNNFQLMGVNTNRDFLRQVITLENYITGNITTSFIADNKQQLQQALKPASNMVLAAAAFFEINNRHIESIVTVEDRTSPWNLANSWRLNEEHLEKIIFLQQQQQSDIICVRDKDVTIIEVNNEKLTITGEIQQHDLLLKINGHAHKYQTFKHNNKIFINDNGEIYELIIPIATGAATEDKQQEGGLTAPMPGTIVNVLVKAGSKVAAGDKLVILEAMKMEHIIYAPKAGKISQLNYKAGDLVDAGAEILAME